MDDREYRAGDGLRARMQSARNEGVSGMVTPRQILPLMPSWLPSVAVPAEHASVELIYLFVTVVKIKPLFIKGLCGGLMNLKVYPLIIIMRSKTSLTDC